MSISSRFREFEMDAGLVARFLMTGRVGFLCVEVTVTHLGYIRWIRSGVIIIKSQRSILDVSKRWFSWVEAVQNCVFTMFVKQEVRHHFRFNQRLITVSTALLYTWFLQFQGHSSKWKRSAAFLFNIRWRVITSRFIRLNLEISGFSDLVKLKTRKFWK